MAENSEPKRHFKQIRIEHASERKQRGPPPLPARKSDILVEERLNTDDESFFWRERALRAESRLEGIYADRQVCALALALVH